MVKKKSRKQRVRYDSLEQINLHAAGLDIGDAEIWAAVPQDRDEQAVRCFIVRSHVICIG